MREYEQTQTIANIAKGVDMAVQDGADIINISFYADEDDDVHERAVPFP